MSNSHSITAMYGACLAFYTVFCVFACATVPESARCRWAISAEFEQCARSLSDAQCAIIYRERCILHGLERSCFDVQRW